MFTVPNVLLIACSFLALYSMAADTPTASSISGPAWFGIITFPIPIALLIMAEYRAIFHRDATAAAWVTGFCLWVPCVGSIGWTVGLLTLTGILPQTPDWQTWTEFGVYSSILLYMGFAGLGHLHWWRVLRASKKIEAIDRGI